MDEGIGIRLGFLYIKYSNNLKLTICLDILKLTYNYWDIYHFCWKYKLSNIVYTITYIYFFMFYQIIFR